MAELTTKERIIEAIRKLPADATIEDAIERLVFLAKIEQGLAQLDSDESVPHEEVRRRFGA
jgi:predicted transcriptional regulator